MALADAGKWAPYIRAAADREGAPAELLTGIVARESRFDVGAFNPEGDGSDPSRGLAQVRQSTARALGYQGHPDNLFDPTLNLSLAAKLLAENLAIASRGAPGAARREVEDRAVSAYNAGFSSLRPGDAKRDSRGELLNRPYVDDVRRLTATYGPLTRSQPQVPTVAGPSGFPAAVPSWALPVAGIVVLLLASSALVRPRQSPAAAY